MRPVPPISRNGIEKLIDQWILGQHAERNRAILRRRLIDGIIYERLAEEFGMSDKQVKRIVYRGTETIFSHWKGGE